MSQAAYQIVGYPLFNIVSERPQEHIHYLIWCIYSLTLSPFQCGGRLYTSESDVHRRQILTYKDGPRTERIQIFLVVVDP